MPSAKRKFTARELLTVGVCLAPLLFLFEYLGKRASGPPAGFSGMMLYLATRWRWDLSDQRWFWGAVVILAAIHIPFVWYVPWSNQWIPAIVRVPLYAVDFFVDLLIFSVGEWFLSSAEV